MSRLDHLVVVADSLDQGVAWCAEQLGVVPTGGGVHDRMGTHNRLLKLGAGVYLEVIAINPAAHQPEFARWFGMDDAELRARVTVSPELRTFAVNTEDIAVAVQALPQLGRVVEMRRDNLQWQISVRPDGVLQEGGCLPTVIEWPPGVHPTSAMVDSGCTLLGLEVHHPQPAQLADKWRAIGLQQDAILELHEDTVPHLVARIATPDGIKRLGVA